MAHGTVLSAVALNIEADLPMVQTGYVHPPSPGFNEVCVAIHFNSDTSHEPLTLLAGCATLQSQVASTLHDGTHLSVALSSPAGP